MLPKKPRAGGAWRQGSKTAGHRRSSLRDYICPHLGDVSVDRVTSADIMAALRPIWTGSSSAGAT